MTDTATETIKATTEQVKGKIDQALKAFEDAGASSKDTYEAFVASFNIAVKGVEGVSSETAAYTKKAVEDLVSTSKAVVGAKSLREVVDIQNDYTKAAFDAFLAFTNKIGEMTVQFTQDAIEPVSRQLGTTFKKFAQPVA
ncbi:phasin family protein [Zavarzinia sp.]|uniref:phasin family protein n=1 Tax=Zavarzinia sp. TaxID=2027920 RepID=UPI0035629161